MSATNPRLLPVNPSKTYATRENAIKAADKFYADSESFFKNVNIRPRYVIMAQEDGRFAVLFMHVGSFFIEFANAGFCVTN